MKNYLWLYVVLALLAGGVFSYFLFPQEVTTEVQVPGPERVVVQNVTVTEEVDVDYKDRVVDKLLLEVAADKDLRKCGGTRFDADEISVKKVYDGFVLTENEDGDVSVSDVKVKLNYDDGKCYKTFELSLDSDNELSY